MSFLKRLDEEGLRAIDFLSKGLALPEYELSFSVKKLKRTHNSFSLQVGLFKGLWSIDGTNQEMEELSSSLCVEGNSEGHRNFIDNLVAKIIFNPQIETLRIAVGKHIGATGGGTPWLNALGQNPHKYESYVDVDVKKIRDHGTSDLLHAFFYYILGYNNNSKELTPLIYNGEVTEWKKLNTVPTALQGLIPQSAHSDSNDSTSIKTLETPHQISPDVET